MIEGKKMQFWKWFDTIFNFHRFHIILTRISFNLVFFFHWGSFLYGFFFHWGSAFPYGFVSALWLFSSCISTFCNRKTIEIDCAVEKMWNDQLGEEKSTKCFELFSYKSRLILIEPYTHTHTHTDERPIILMQRLTI